MLIIAIGISVSDDISGRGEDGYFLLPVVSDSLGETLFDVSNLSRPFLVPFVKGFSYLKSDWSPSGLWFPFPIGELN